MVPQTPTQSTDHTELTRPSGLQFSMRSILVVMVVLAVVTACAAPWLREWPLEWWTRIGIVVGCLLSGFAGGLGLGYFQAHHARSKGGYVVAILADERAKPSSAIAKLGGYASNIALIVCPIIVAAFTELDSGIDYVFFLAIFANAFIVAGNQNLLGLSKKRVVFEVRENGIVFDMGGANLLLWKMVSRLRVSGRTLSFYIKGFADKHEVTVANSSNAAATIERVCQFFDEKAIEYQAE